MKLPLQKFDAVVHYVRSWPKLDQMHHTERAGYHGRDEELYPAKCIHGCITDEAVSRHDQEEAERYNEACD